ncbi:hypothetical protein [Actinokineospora bangkokensis]|uniref:Mce-associated membrane protein n=1 Tax=Actinokineospora bangkokensis TaxID=1193682 RepID=A0A1Q9LN78_9PSEU|nr:hypothetical protein [Actinokineospora bangkokensis]OLR93444.1 hypothetical protein BJP25_14130 [Actinokineospora bangkokensis]
MRPGSRRGWALPLVSALVAVAVAAGVLVLALSAGGSRVSASPLDQDPVEVRLTDARDGALAAARRGVAALNTERWTSIDADLDAQEQVSTGAQLEAVRARRAADRQAVVGARTRSTAVVHDAAVEEVDPDAGTATVLAAVGVLVEAPGSAPTARHASYAVSMTRTPGGWLVAAVEGIGAG